MEIFPVRRDIPFMRHVLVFNVISIVTFLIVVVSLATRGLNFGVDFTGGTVMEVSYAQAADLGVAGGKGIGLIFKRGEVIRKVPEAQIVDALMEEVRKFATEKAAEQSAAADA